MWTLALTRKDLSFELQVDSKLRLINGLSAVASKNTKRGLLAALLASKLSRSLTIA